MPRYDRDGEEIGHLPYCRKLYYSNRINPDDKKWIDDIFIRSNLKISEEERLYGLYRKIFGDEDP